MKFLSLRNGTLFITTPAINPCMIFGTSTVQGSNGSLYFPGKTTLTRRLFTIPLRRKGLKVTHGTENQREPGRIRCLRGARNQHWRKRQGFYHPGNIKDCHRPTNCAMRSPQNDTYFYRHIFLSKAIALLSGSFWMPGMSSGRLEPTEATHRSSERHRWKSIATSLLLFSSYGAGPRPLARTGCRVSVISQIGGLDSL